MLWVLLLLLLPVAAFAQDGEIPEATRIIRPDTSIVGSWKGKQALRLVDPQSPYVEALYTFEWGTDGKLAGRVEFYRPSVNRFGSGEIRELLLNGSVLTFVVANRDENERLDGTESAYTLTLYGDVLRGTGYNRSRRQTFEIELVRVR